MDEVTPAIFSPPASGSRSLPAKCNKAEEIVNNQHVGKKKKTQADNHSPTEKLVDALCDVVKNVRERGLRRHDLNIDP
eukprot:915529-Ditylum_brightwellii.AAC.1